MGPKERRERERDATRGRIIDAARELFATEGYDAVTMRRIAKQIEYTPTAIYFHFKDKESLLREICDCDFGALGEDLARLGQIPDPVERLRALGMGYAAFGLRNPNHYRLMFMTPGPGITSERIERGNPEEDAYANLKAVITDGIDAGRYISEDPDLLAQTMWAGIHGVVSLQIAKCNDEWVDWRPIEDRLRVMIDTLISGIVKESHRG